MDTPPLDMIRNIGIISHIDAGKTTVSERILFYTGETHKMGEVHEGEAVMDWMPQEQERGITITATATTCRWKHAWINLIDTPGHIDFTIEVERSMRVLDGAIAVFSAVEGVQPQSESVWRQAERYRVPRICFINKMDRIGSDYTKTVHEIGSKLRARPILLQLPVGTEGEFAGVIDLIEEQTVLFAEHDQGQTVHRGPVSPDRGHEVQEARQLVIEAAADFDDSILTDYLEGNAIDGERLRKAVARGTIACRIFPVLLGSALRNKGIQPVLDAVADFLPSPLQAAQPHGYTANPQEPQPIPCDPKAPVCALAFKVLSEEGKKLTFLRIYSGSLQAGAQLLNSSRRCHERLNQLFRMHAHKRERIQFASAGDIVATLGPREVLTGDTFCDPAHPVVLERLTVPEPVVSLAVEPKGVDDRDKLLPALEKLQWEDPTFRVREDPETGQTILNGMGELHLEIIIDRLARDFGVRVKTGPPKVVYRETVKEEIERREHFHREIEGRIQEGEVLLRLVPLPRGSGVRLSLPEVEESPLPAALRQVLEQSLLQACSAGCRTGYPLTDLAVQVVEVPFQPGVTTELGLRAAAQRGLVQSAANALVLLEPVMALEIVTPDEHAGKVLGTLQQKRSRVEGINAREGEQVISAQVPLAEMFGYMTELRSTTKGRGTFTMEFSHFDIAPADTQRKLGLA